MRKASQGIKKRMRYSNISMGRVQNGGPQSWLQLALSEALLQIPMPESCSQRSWLEGSGEEPVSRTVESSPGSSAVQPQLETTGQDGE